jgi:hypothetical protein
LLLLGLGVAVGEAAALAVAAKRWFAASPAPAGSPFEEPVMDEAALDLPPSAEPPFDVPVPAPEPPAPETVPPAPAFVERRAGERRSGEERRRSRSAVVERIARATERRSGVERRSGTDRRHPVATESVSV